MKREPSWGQGLGALTQRLKERLYSFTRILQLSEDTAVGAILEEDSNPESKPVRALIWTFLDLKHLLWHHRHTKTVSRFSFSQCAEEMIHGILTHFCKVAFSPTIAVTFPFLLPSPPLFSLLPSLHLSLPSFLSLSLF